MRKTLIGSVLFISAASAGACLGPSESETSQFVQVAGAIFTTTADGTVVNENVHYLSKSAVYLDGGPGPNAPNSAACLPAGFYYFMVTDPPGKVLLSTDAIGCRRFEVTAACTVDYAPQNCATPHVVSEDENDEGDVIQLMPYNDTPNNGDEYKAWATPVGSYNLNAPGNNFGFVNSDSKTDNFKVRNPEEGPICGDGNVDPGEECDDGNGIDDDECSNDCKLCPPEPYCGDGNVDPGEQCDDGNTIDDDSCTNSCELCPPDPEPYCGDGNVDPGEQCDDGNTINDDTCTNSCELCDPGEGPGSVDA